MPRGFTVPRSPLGLAAIDPSPPWHYSGDVIGVEYWADPRATANFLPEGLVADPESNGHAVIMFLDGQFTAQNEEYLDPARYQYREAFILVDACWDQMPVTFCPLIYVDNDAALARGWIQGFPTRVGSIFQTRAFAASGPASPPIAPGGRFGASLSTHGVRLAEACVTLESKVGDPTSIFDRPTALLRYFPRLEKDKRHAPAVHQLTLLVTENLQTTDMWIGDAELSFYEARGEEMHGLAPLRVGSGFRYSIAYSLTDTCVVADFID
jgi:hypothetical protein